MDGLSTSAIADALGRSLPSVKCRLSAERIFKPRARLVWLDLLSGPHTIRGVAAALGVSYGTVKQTKRRLRRAGFALPPADRN
jgi:DNA-directed RNA polymerase specialized sigma24 family protein